MEVYFWGISTQQHLHSIQKIFYAILFFSMEQIILIGILICLLCFNGESWQKGHTKTEISNIIIIITRQNNKMY